MAILVDSGWYDIDLNKMDKYQFGKDAGCDFFNYFCAHTKYSEYYCENQDY